jgi:ribose/xylose/arabinose/galactoside ABC-type transport system permease subunit
VSEQVLEQPAQGPVPLAGPLPGRPKGPVRAYLDNLESSSRDSLGTAVAILVLWGILVVVSTIYHPDFLSHQTLLSVTFTMAVLGVVTVAQSLVTISGGILDLSIPTALILPSWVIVTLLAHGVNLVLTIFVGLLTGAAWGTLNALIIVFGKLNPLIVTLGTNFAGAAIVNIYLTSAQTPLGSSLAKWGQLYFLGLPNVFWVMALFILLAGYYLKRSRVGRRVVAVGGNPQAARVRGISLRKVRFGVFIGSGVICGVAAVLFTASTLNFVSSETTNYLLPSVAATILAGIRLQGGSGNLWVIFLSVGLLATVPTALAFFGVGELWQNVPPGVILIVAVCIDGLRQMRSKR